MSRLTCPKCRNASLVDASIRHSDVQVAYCTGCGGLWLPAEALARYLRDDVQTLAPPRKAEESRLLCPACAAGLVAFRYLQTFVTIDLCPSCRGVWLDANELQEVDTVRRHHRRQGTLESLPPVEGVKGAFINLINDAIRSLNPF